MADDDDVDALARSGKRCFHVDTDEGGEPITISASVGQSGINIPADVRVIQTALNSLDPKDGPPQPLLKVDSASGPFTIAAILKFQKLHHCQPDGRVDVGQKTLAALNDALGGGGEIAAAAKQNKGGKAKPREFVLPDPSLVAAMIALVPQVHLAVRAADAACLLADRFITTSPLTRPPNVSPPALLALQRLEQTFSLKKLRNPRPAFENIKRVYRNMLVALNRSFATEPSLAAVLFVSNTDKQMGEEALAYTSAGGAFKGPKSRLKNVRVPSNRIYLCNSLADKSRTMQIATLVHELAHYVSGQPIKIDDPFKDNADMFDPADTPRFHALKPEQKIASADHYAFFALMCAGPANVT